MKKLFIFGITDFALSAVQYFTERTEWKIQGFVVDAEYKDREEFCGLPVYDLSECEKVFPPTEYFCFVAAGYRGMNKTRREKIKYFKSKGYSLASYVDPSCQRFSNVSIGDNCFIMENVVLQPGVVVEDGVYMGSGVCVGHDTRIQQCAFIAIGAMIAGFVTVGENSFIGANATVNNGLTIAAFTLLGAGAYVTKGTTKYGVYLTEHSRNVLKKVGNSKELQNGFLK